MNASYSKAFNQDWNRYRAFLKKRQRRLTRGRRKVFELAMRTHGHFRAEDLVQKARRHDPPVSRATVYRTLKELLEAGVVRETAYGCKHTLFEHLYDEPGHHHARCVRCGFLLEFPDQGEDHIYHTFLKKHGFKVLGHEMHFYGLCRTCRIHHPHGDVP